LEDWLREALGGQAELVFEEPFSCTYEGSPIRKKKE
jgi:hypothetical protein